MTDNNEHCYTQLIAKVKLPREHGEHEVSLIEPMWDADGEQLVEMFHTIMIGLTFNEDTFVDSFISWMNNVHPEYTIEKKQNTKDI